MRILNTKLQILEHHFILLHGALGSSRAFHALEAALKNTGTVAAPDFPWHRGKPGKHAEFQLDEMIACIAEAARPHVPTTLFGYSMGGYVAALGLARKQIHAERLVTLGTKWIWSPEIAEGEKRKLNAAKMWEKVPAFAQQLTDVHKPVSVEELCEKTGRFLDELGRLASVHGTEFTALQTGIQVLRGNEDLFVTREECEQMMQVFPHASHKTVQGKHPFESVPTEYLAEILCP